MEKSLHKKDSKRNIEGKGDLSSSEIQDEIKAETDSELSSSTNDEPKASGLKDNTSGTIKPLTCSICQDKFATKDQLTSHIKDHFKAYTCHLCEKEFIGDTQFAYHQKNAHQQPEDPDTLEIYPSRKCLCCSEECADSETLKKHLLTCRLNKGESLFMCDYCDKTSNSAGRLKRHIREKHSTILHKHAVACDICGRICKNNEAVILHRKTHGDDKDFICDYCGKGFTRKKNLEFHIRTHTGLRPFKCDLCAKSFAHISGLNCHVRTHTKERPFKCPYCAKSYIHSTDLRRHRRTHGGEEKRFQCDMCERKFFEKKFLVSHQKSHKKITSQVINIEVRLKEDTDEECGPINEEYML